MGMHPLTAFSSVAHLGSHDKVARAVYDGWVVGGAGHDGAVLDLAKAIPDASQALERLCWTEEIPSDPVVAHVADAQWLEWLRASFLSVSDTGAGKPGHDPDRDFGFWGGSKRLGRIESSRYQPLQQALEELMLKPEDVLR